MRVRSIVAMGLGLTASVLARRRARPAGRPDRAAARRPRGPAAPRRRPRADRAAPLPPPPARPTPRRRRRARPAAAVVAGRRRRAACWPISAASAARASTRPIMIPPGSIAAMRSGDPLAHGRRPRPTASTSCRRTSRSAMSAATPASAGMSSTRTSTTRASAQLLDAALATQPHRRRAQRPAADPSAIWRAAERAVESRPQTETAQDQPHPAQHGPLALAAARPWAEIYHRQRARVPRHAGREWRDPLEAQGDRRRDQDADAAAERDGDRRDPQPVVGSADKHLARKSRASPAMSRSRARTARSSAGASRRGRAMRSASSSS